MFTASIENVKGDILTLTGNETNYQIISITGLNPPNAQINMSTIAGMDGAKYNSSKLETRQIVINLKINGDVENNRQNLYKYFPTKEWCKFYFENANRNVFIEGYAQTFEVDLFAQQQISQIVIDCPQPYFKDMETIIDDISKVIAAFEFPFAFGSTGATNPDVPIIVGSDDAIPFSLIEANRITDIYNNSSAETGLIIEIDVYDNVNTIELRNTQTGETLTLDYSFIAEDQITINTNKGEKSITLLRNGVSYNLFTALQTGSTFFQLAVGDNFFSYTADDGTSDSFINIVFKHNTVYRGV